MKKLTTVLDLGSSKIAACTCRINNSGQAVIVALDSLYSRGIKAGDITDIHKAVEDISAVLGRLQRVQRKKIKSVFVTCKGADIRMDISRGMIPLSKTPREITQRDIKKCLEIAALVKVPPARTIIQKIIKGLYIDGSALRIKNPIGLYGLKLEAEIFIATARQSKIQNIAKCIDRAGLLLDGICLSSVAGSNTVLDESEKEKGVLLLDIGESLTEGLVFQESALKKFCVVERGASHIRPDGMRINAERLKAIVKELLCSLPAEKGDYNSAVITGGGALIDGIIEEAEEILKTPTRIGLAKKAGRHLNSQEALIHVSTLGLIGHIAKEYRMRYAHRSLFHRLVRRLLDIYSSYF